MKLIATTALAVLLAFPAYAKKWNMPFIGHCTDSFAEIEEVYGPLTEVLKRISNLGFGILLAKNETSEVLVAIPPDMTFCVLWDDIKVEGEAL